MLFAVDVTELVFDPSGLCHDCNIKGSRGRDGATHAGHHDDGDVVKRNVRGWLGNEHEGFVEAVEVAFVCFYAAFDARLLVVADKVFGRDDDFLAGEPTEDLRYNRVLGGFITGL